MWVSFFFQAEDSIRDYKVTGVQTCALPILSARAGMLTKFSRPPGAICIVIFPVPDVLRLIDATSKVGPAPWGTEIGRAHVELQSPCNLVCRLLLEKKKKPAAPSHRNSMRQH